jgi:hypothetical protein
MSLEEDLRVKANEFMIGSYTRHIFLCADQTEPKCSPKAASIESWNYLKKRLKDLHLSIAQDGVFRTKANCGGVSRRRVVSLVYACGA